MRQTPEGTGTVVPAEASLRRHARFARSAALPWLPAGGLVVVVLLGTGTAASAIAAYIAYLLFAVLLPGTLVHRALRGATSPVGVELALGTATGLALELLAWAVATAASAQAYLRWWPLLVVVPSALTPAGRRLWRRSPPPPGRPAGGTATSWVVAVVYAYLTLVVALPAIRSTALPPRPSSWYQDLYWHLSIAADLTQRVPPNVPQVAGRTLRYHWFSDAHLAASHLISGVPLPTVLVRLWLLPVIAVVLGLLVAVAHRLSGRLWPGAVAAALNAAPAMLVPWRGFRPPTTGVIVPSSPSQVYGVVFLLLAVDVLIDVIRGQRVGRGWLLVLLAVAAASGSKPSVLPVLLVGLCCALAVNLARRRAVRPTIGAAVLVVGVLALSARTVAGSTSGSSLRVGGILAFLSPWRRYTGERALTGTGGWFVPGLHPGRAAVVAGLLGAVLLLQYTWVLCGLPLLRRPTRADPAVAALAGSTLAGLTALLVLDHPSASQIYFALTAAPLAALLAGWGLACALAGPTTDSTWRRRIGASSIGLTAGIAVAVAAAVTAVGIARASAPRARTSAQIPFALAQPMIVLLLLGLLGTAGWLVLRRSRPGLRGGGVGVLCLALVAGSLLTGPARGVSRLPADLRSAGTVPRRAVSGPETVAAQWISRHAGPNDVVATNVHCLTFHTRPQCDARAFWVSAFTERRVLVEGWGYTDEAQAANGRGGRSYHNQPFDDPALLAANDRVFTDPSAPALARLRAAHGVRWLFADRRAGPVSARLATLADLRVDSPTVEVFALHAQR